MDESEKFAADILGVTPDDVSVEDSNELLTNNEEETLNEDQYTEEASQTSDQEELESDNVQGESDKNIESNLKPESKEPKRSNRIERRIQSLLAKQNELKSQNSSDYGDTLTHEQLQEVIRKEAQILMQEQELLRLEQEHKEMWAEDLENLIQTNPELNPESQEYNKQLDDFLTRIITNPNGEVNTNIPIGEVYNQLNAIIGEKKQVKIRQSKKALNQQFDETSLSNGLQGDYQKSKKTLDDLDPNNPSEFTSMIEKGLV